MDLTNVPLETVQQPAHQKTLFRLYSDAECLTESHFVIQVNQVNQTSGNPSHTKRLSFPRSLNSLKVATSLIKVSLSRNFGDIEVAEVFLLKFKPKKFWKADQLLKPSSIIGSL